MITYIATNTKTGKFYIGSTTNLDWRKYCHHVSKLNYPFQNALRKNPEDFIWEHYEDDLEEPILEQALLDKWYGVEQCYNLCPSAGRPPKCKGHTEKTKSKMKETRTTSEYVENAREKTLNKFTDEEYREFHRQQTILGSNTPEAIKRNSDAGKKRWQDPSYREMMRKSRLGKGLPWWVRDDGTTTRAKQSPGPEWKSGRKWKP